MSVLLDEGELEASSRGSCNQLACALAVSSRSTIRVQKELGFYWLQTFLSQMRRLFKGGAKSGTALIRVNTIRQKDVTSIYKRTLKNIRFCIRLALDSYREARTSRVFKMFRRSFLETIPNFFNWLLKCLLLVRSM